MGKQKFYVVWKGNNPGVYQSWEKCQNEIKNVNGALFKSFSSLEEAKKAYDQGYEEYKQSLDYKNVLDGPELNSISVDAASSGNPGLMEYQGKELINVAKEDIADDEETKKVSEGDQEIISKVHKHLDGKVSDVIISKRLTDSASCIVLPKHEPGAQLRKILEASGQTLGSSNPIFEINMKHKLVKKLKDMKGKQFNSFVDFLYDYAVIAEGGSPQDPSKYLRQLDKYLS